MTLSIYAAGSLRYALPALTKLFQAEFNVDISSLFSPAGLLCDKIQQEARNPVAHLFASANTAHPQTLVNKGLAKKHIIFAHNRLCLLVRNQPDFLSQDWLTLLLESKNRIGMSTPHKDPSGDYTFSLFDHIEQQYTGKGKSLKQRAKQLVGGALASNILPGRHPAEQFLLNSTVDIFIGYANNAANLTQSGQLAVIDIPATFYQPINYSIALLNHPHPFAEQFISFLLSEIGQHCLQKYGYIPVST